MKQLISKLMSFISSTKPDPVTSTPLIYTENFPDSKTITDHLLDLKNLSGSGSKKVDRYGMDFIIGHEKDYIVAAVFEFTSIPSDKFFEINEFLKTRCRHLLTTEEWMYDIISTQLNQMDRSSFCLVVSRTYYSSLQKYFDVVIEVCRSFDIKCDRSVHLSIRNINTFYSKLAVGVLYIDEGYYETVSLDYLVSLHLK